MDKFTRTASLAATRAGDELLSQFRKETVRVRGCEVIAIQERGLSKEITSDSDYAADKIILSVIENSFPHHNILTEETGEIPKGSPYTWIVDPLDGSGNYLNRNPFFSISIALAYENQIILGVIYAPQLGELIIAEKGKGCTVNGKQVRVSNTHQLEKSYIVGCEGGDPSNVRFAKMGHALHKNIKDFRKIGSAAIEGFMVASGRVDAFTTLNISSWDVAAAILCVEEAGGTVTDFNGNPWDFEKTDLLMSNGRLHDAILKELAENDITQPAKTNILKYMSSVRTNEISSLKP